jgi:hypothetical protein
MSTLVVVEGDPLNDLWLPYTDAPGAVPDGKFDGRVVHTADSSVAPPAPNTLDGVAELICQGKREYQGELISFSTWITQTAGPLHIYSTYRGLDPFLCFSCRVELDFTAASSKAVMTLTNVDNSSAMMQFNASTSGLSVKIGSKTFAFTETILADIIIQLAPDRLLTRKFDIYIAAKCLDKMIIGAQANYETKVYIHGAIVHELASFTSRVRFNDRYKAEFRCSTTL